MPSILRNLKKDKSKEEYYLNNCSISDVSETITTSGGKLKVLVK